MVRAGKGSAFLESSAATSGAGTGRSRFRLFAALHEPAFRTLWLSMLPAMLALQMGQVAIGYTAFEISGAATSLGLIAAGSGIPMLSLSMIGGVVADRARKRTVLFFTQGTHAISAVINAVLVLTGVIQVWHLFLVALAQGTAFAFNMPSRQAMIAEITSEENMTNAIALNNAGANLSRVVGPALAGGLIGVSFIGSGGIFVIMATMYLSVILLLFRLPPGTARRKSSSGVDQLLEGFHYVRNHAVLRMLLGLAIVPVLIGMPYVQMMPVFAVNVFDAGGQGLGYLMAANGIGALIGSLVIASASDLRRKGLVQLGLGLSFGLSLALFAFGQSYLLGLLAITFVGGTSAAYTTLNSTLIIQHTDRAYHGRVMSLWMMTFGMMPLGSIPTSWLVDQFSAPIVVGLAGLVLAGIVASVALASPTYRRI